MEAFGLPAGPGSEASLSLDQNKLVAHMCCAKVQRGNQGAATEYQQRMADVWRKHDANPFTNMLGAAAQAPVFIGFFSALRAMALAKVRLLLLMLCGGLRAEPFAEVFLSSSTTSRHSQRCPCQRCAHINSTNVSTASRATGLA